jgi:hypothetical protein
MIEPQEPLPYTDFAGYPLAALEFSAGSTTLGFVLASALKHFVEDA